MSASLDGTAQGRGSRFWLYAPFVMLLLVAAAWTGAWFVIRSRTTAGLDAFFANEQAAGRQWSCPDRRVGGYPFRIEVVCPTLAVQRGDLQAALGRVHAVAQVYQPRHIIAEVEGPLRAGDGRVTVDGQWRNLRISVRTGQGGVQRVSLVAAESRLQVSGLAPVPLAAASDLLEAHLRPDPARFQSEGAFDVALSAKRALIPGLNELVGGTDPADLTLDLTATQARDGATRPLREELERWRQAGGRIAVEAFSLVKGPRRLEAKGELALDELRRPIGRLDLSAVGLEGVIGSLVGRAAGGAGGLAGGLAGGIIGSLLGAPREAPKPAAPGSPGQPALSALPPLRLENGRVFVGPFPVPGLRLTPLY